VRVSVDDRLKDLARKGDDRGIADVFPFAKKAPGENSDSLSSL